MADDTLVIRSAARRILLYGALAFLFMAVGCGLMILPPLQRSIIPLNKLLQPLVGLVGAGFGLFGLVVIVRRALRPLLHLTPSHLHGPSLQTPIPWEAIREAQRYDEYGGVPARFIVLTVPGAARYVAPSALQQGFGEDRIVLNLALASQQDFHTVNAWLQRHLSHP